MEDQVMFNSDTHDTHNALVAIRILYGFQDICKEPILIRLRYLFAILENCILASALTRNKDRVENIYLRISVQILKSSCQSKSNRSKHMICCISSLGKVPIEILSALHYVGFGPKLLAVLLFTVEFQKICFDLYLNKIRNFHGPWGSLKGQNMFIDFGFWTGAWTSVTPLIISE